MVTHRLPLDRAQEAFRLVIDAGESIKVIIQPAE
jgi:threonine dehydrogenase-like Zn-dependent dehydrogenase